MCYTTNINKPVKVCKKCNFECSVRKDIKYYEAKCNQININGVYNSLKVKSYIHDQA